MEEETISLKEVDSGLITITSKSGRENSFCATLICDTYGVIIKPDISCGIKDIVIDFEPKEAE